MIIIIFIDIVWLYFIQKIIYLYNSIILIDLIENLLLSSNIVLQTIQQ